MAGQVQRSGDKRGGCFYRRADLARDAGDPVFGAERIGRHRNGETGFERAGRQMRPTALVETHPVAAMDEDDEPFWGTNGTEQVETVALALAVGDCQFR